MEQEQEHKEEGALLQRCVLRAGAGAAAQWTCASGRAKRSLLLLLAARCGSKPLLHFVAAAAGDRGRLQSLQHSRAWQLPNARPHCQLFCVC